MSNENFTLLKQDGDMLSFHVNYLPDFVLKKCVSELKETPENKRKGLQEIRKKLAADPTTSDVDFENDLLTQYLRHSKYDVNKAVKFVKNFVVLRRKQPGLFEGIPDEYFFTNPSAKIFVLLPRRCPDGCTMLIHKIGIWNPNELAVEDYKRLWATLFFQLQRDPMSQINGYKAIYDFHGSTFNHLRHITPKTMYLFCHAFMNCIPGRYKEAHLINQTAIFGAIWTVLKRCLSDKITNRVFFHSKVEELLNHFPRSVLPAEYGGDLGDFNTVDWIKRANMEQKNFDVEGQPNYY